MKTKKKGCIHLTWRIRRNLLEVADFWLRSPTDSSWSQPTDLCASYTNCEIPATTGKNSHKNTQLNLNKKSVPSWVYKSYGNFDAIIYYTSITKSERIKEQTSGDGLFVSSDIVNGGWDFPVERATYVEDDKEKECHHRHSEDQPCSCWSHCTTAWICYSLCADCLYLLEGRKQRF